MEPSVPLLPEHVQMQYLFIYLFICTSI